MSYSQIEYTGNGSAVNYSIPFNYISQSHVKVFVNTVLVTNYTFTSTNIITFSIAPVNGAIILIKRETPLDNPIVEFQDGSTLTEDDLNKSATQVFYAIQENADTLNTAQEIADSLPAINAAVASAESSSSAAVAAATDATDAVAALDVDTIARTSGSNATGTWPIGISGTAANSTNLGGVAGSAFAQLAVDQAWTGSQRGEPVTDNDLSFDLLLGNNFTCSYTGAGTLTFTNRASTAGQSGWIKFVQSGSGTVAAAANSKITAANLTRLGAAGTYVGSYYCDGTDVYVSIGTYA